MPVTLADLAELAGVSRMTVSEVLRGVGRASAATRERILKLAKQKGYRPNASARAIRTGRSGTIALLTSSLPHRTVLPSMLTDGVFNTLAQNDLHLTLVRLTDELLADETYVPRILREWSCDGLLISYALNAPPRLAELIEKHRLPSVWMNLKREDDCVYADELGAARSATRKLIDLGHRKVAYADYQHGRGGLDHYSAVDRQRGYELEMEAAGLAPIFLRDVDPLVTDHYVQPPNFHGGRRLYYSLQWLSQKDRPTAVLTHGHETATPIMMAAERLGLKLGAELAMITFGDEVLWITSLACSTMVLRGEEMGRQAVEMLVEKIAHPRRRLAPRTVAYKFSDVHTTGNNHLAAD